MLIFFVVLLMNYSEVETAIKIFCGGFRVLCGSSTSNCRPVDVRRATQQQSTGKISWLKLRDKRAKYSAIFFSFPNLKTDSLLKTAIHIIVHGKDVSLHACRTAGDWVSRNFQDNQHVKVTSLSVLGNGRLYPPETILVLISVRD